MMKQIGMLNLCNKDNWRWNKFFCLFLSRIDPMNSSLTALFFAHCSNLLFRQLHFIWFILSCFLFLNFCFVPRQLYCAFIIIVHALSVFSVAFGCLSVFFKVICHLCFYTFIEHVCSRKHTGFYCFVGLCFVERDSALNLKLIDEETD